MGTIHVMEAIRATESVKVGVMITTDKCYENKEQIWGYREDEPMGGYDPYSSSRVLPRLLSIHGAEVSLILPTMAKSTMWR